MTAEAKRDVLAEFEAMVAAMSDEEKAELDKILAPELQKAWLANPGKQADALLSEADILLYGGQAGGGKLLDLTTDVPTPSGWTSVGKISMGDLLFDEQGKQCRVTALSPIDMAPKSYRLTFDDGSQIVACADHQWLTFDAKELGDLLRKSPEWRAARRAKRPSRATGNKSAAFMEAIAKANANRIKPGPMPSGTVRTTQEIVDTLTADRGRANHAIPVAGAIDMPKAPLPVAPYVLGAWLGDGTTVSGGFTNPDTQIVDEIRRAGYFVKTSRVDAIHHHIWGLSVQLRSLDVLGNKHVPNLYLRGSEDQRLALLQGLMDTDGHAALDGGCEFDNTNRAIIDAVAELVLSLGMRVSVTEGRATLYGKDCGPKYRVAFVANRRVFRLDRKAERQRQEPRQTTRFRYIKSAVEIDPVPMRCLSVDSPSRLFLVSRSFIPTHNSALEIGTFFEGHHSGIIFRREGTQLDGLIEYCKKVGEPRFGKYVGGNENVFKRRDGGRLKFAGLNAPDDWRKHAGNARDYIAFDEAGEFLREQVMSIIGWLRSTRPGQRCRMILGSNPPRGGDGEWMIEEFAPWLDPTFESPAADGELRWAIVVASQTEWVDGPGMHVRGDESYEAMSRTFISASLDDNPYLKDTGYRAKIQSLPEPLRSQLLYGDFLAGRQDHEWQVIPSEWVRAANERWRRADAHKRRRMLALAADIALGGADNLVMARLHEDNWFAPLEVREGKEFGGATGSDRIAALLLKYRKDAADLSVDGTGGWAAGARSHLAKDHETECASIIFSKGSNAKAKDSELEFKNLRVEMYWTFREALHPELGDDICLPPDNRLFAELTAQRYFIKGKEIWMLPKEKQPVSPDRSDAVVMAWRRRNAWGRKMAIKAQNKTLAPPVPAGPNSWMG